MQEIIQEQITRVLLERLIVNRPHPWGLLITFIELIKVGHLHPIFNDALLYAAFDCEDELDSMSKFVCPCEASVITCKACSHQF